MTAEQIIEKIRHLPGSEIKKVARFLDTEFQDLIDKMEARKLWAEFEKPGEQGAHQ